jgi:CoA:oxalate CoA-transferase
MMPTAAIGDTMTGVHGFGGVMAALFNRSRTGLGDWVQVSLLDSYIHCHEINIQAFTGSNGAVVPGPTGAVHPTVVPCGIFTVRGVHLFIACVNPVDWSRFAAAMGRPELGDDPDYRTNGDRVVRKDQIIAMIDAWLAGFENVDDAVTVLDRHGVACCRILSVPEAIVHPHNLARRAVRTVADDRWGTITVPGMPIRLASATEPELRAEELGESTVAVLRDINGYDDERIAALVQSGAVTVAPGTDHLSLPDTSPKETP